MRIVLLTGHSLSETAIGGINSWIKSFYASLQAHGHEVLIVNYGPLVQANDHTLAPLDTILKISKENNVDEFHKKIAIATLDRMNAMHGSCLITTSLEDASGFASFPSNIPIVTVVHGNSEEEGRYWSHGWRWLRDRWQIRRQSKTGIRASTLIVCPSSWLKRWLETFGEEQKIVVIPSGLRADVEKQAPIQYKEWDLQDMGTLCLGLTNSLHNPHRLAGFTLFVEALAELEKMGRSLPRIKVIGGKPGDKYFEEARRRALRFKTIELMGQKSNPSDILRTVNMFVHCSLLDSFSMSLLEAMALGLPCISTNIGGIPEVVGSSKSAVLVPPQPKAIADAIVNLFSSPQKAIEMGRAARLHAFDHFLWSQLAQKWEETLLSLVSTSRES